jgi:Flp pilus assembly protein TadG
MNMILSRPTTRARLRRSVASCRRGATSIEVAIVAPLFFLLVLATVEFSRVSMLRNLVQDASYEAARECMVEGATSAEATELVQRLMRLVAAKAAEVRINDGAGLKADSESIKVEVSLPLNQNCLALGWICGDTVLSATTELKTERYNGYYQSN